MVLAGKVFVVRERMELATIASKLRDYRREEVYEEGGKTLKLITEVMGIAPRTNAIKAVFSYDQVIRVPQRGELVPIVRTFEAPFWFTEFGDKVLLTVLEKKFRANYVANSLSEILFIAPGAIAEARISPEALREFHEKNPENTRVIFFDDVDIPNVEKLSLYGEELRNTSLYNEYLSRGKIWYIVFTSRTRGYVVGLTRNAVVVVFSDVDEEAFYDYVYEEIFPLIE